MATGTAPVMPTRGAAAATTKKTMPRTPSRPEDSRSSGAVCRPGVSGPAAGTAVVSGSLITGRRPGAAPRGAGCADAVCRGGGGHVQGRVPVEEPHGLELEARVVDRHDRPVLGTWDVGQAEGVPHDEVLAVDVAVGRCVLGQARATAVLVDEVPGRVPLGRVVAGHPQVLPGEGRSP